MRKSYLIHDNGATPFSVGISKVDQMFAVVITSNRMQVYSYLATNIFIGKSKKTEMTKPLGSYGRKFDGNTILLHIKDLEYVWIGNRGIQSFTALAPIVKFESPVGNNDVPYPYAYDTAMNAYPMLEDEIVLDFQSGVDPYDCIYDKTRKAELRTIRFEKTVIVPRE